MLYIFSGLPGTGKSTLSRFLAGHTGAVWVRIDTIEQVLRDQGMANVGGTGYEVAYRVARDNLDAGRSVVADSVNPLQITRKTWREVAASAGCPCIDIEITCSDQTEHRTRIESRATDIEGLRLPSWQDVVNREYDPWESNRLVIDTAGKTVSESEVELLEALSAVRPNET